jgi:hypothetical protein
MVLNLIYIIVQNEGSVRWTVRRGVEMAITFLGQYNAGRGVITKIRCRDPLFFKVKFYEVFFSIEVNIPFPVGKLLIII